MSLNCILYVSKDYANSHYLTITCAKTLYLSKLEASTTYLTYYNANNLYVSKSYVISNYLTISNAASIYLSKIDATSLYLKINSATSLYVDFSSTQTIPGIKTFNNIKLNITNDSLGSPGTNGQILSSTVSGVKWIDSNYLQYPVAQGNQTMLNTDISGTLTTTDINSTDLTIYATNNIDVNSTNITFGTNTNIISISNNTLFQNSNGSIIIDVSDIEIYSPISIYSVTQTSPNQIGWTQGFSSSVNGGTFTTTNLIWSGTYVTCPLLPAGVYLITFTGSTLVSSGITGGSIYHWASGYCYSTTNDYNTRIALEYISNNGNGVCTKTAGQYTTHISYVIRVSDNTYLSGYILTSIQTTLTGGTMENLLGSYSLTRIG